MQCVDCVKDGARTAPVVRTRFGAPVQEGRPLVTYTLIGLCGAVFVAQLVVPGVTNLLAFYGILAGVEPWRLLTTAFVHSPTMPLHIVFNLYVLFVFGPMLESLLGRVKFVLVYLICALGGSVGVLLLSTPNPGWLVSVVGASGAIFGLVLLYVVLSLRQGQVPRQLLVILALNFALPLVVPQIAWQAHVGGALTGAAIGGLLALTAAPGRSAEAARRRRLIWPALAALTLVLVVLGGWRLWSVLGPAGFPL